MLHLLKYDSIHGKFNSKIKMIKILNYKWIKKLHFHNIQI